MNTEKDRTVLIAVIALFLLFVLACCGCGSEVAK